MYFIEFYVYCSNIHRMRMYELKSFIAIYLLLLITFSFFDLVKMK